MKKKEKVFPKETSMAKCFSNAENKHVKRILKTSKRITVIKKMNRINILVDIRIAKFIEVINEIYHSVRIRDLEKR